MQLIVLIILLLLSNILQSMKEAMFYQRLANQKVQCVLCPHECIIGKNSYGFCRNRRNMDGKLYSIVYGKPSAIHIDPVEKEPQLHFLPGSFMLCIATVGCNIRCAFCHNWHIAQVDLEDTEYYEMTPDDIVNLAIRRKVPSISFTYVEPTTFYEYMLDISKKAKQKGLRIIVHSNGMIKKEPLLELLKYTDSWTIDFKSIDPKFYKSIAFGDLDTLLETMKTIKAKNRWLELVNLHIPTVNDNPELVRKMCNWIKENLSKDVPLHFSRFFPNHKMLKTPPTDIKQLEAAYRIAKETGLNYVTIGNVPGHRYNSTYCASCNKRLIYRIHFEVLENNIIKGRCKFCNNSIPGVWE